MNYETTNNGIPLKRTRVSRACNFCRKKKIKCNIDQQMPCSSCVQYRCECTSNDSPRKRPPPKGYIESLEMRLQSMEKLLRQRLVYDTGTGDSHEGNSYDTSISGDSDDTAKEEEDQDDNDSSSSTPADLHSTKVIRHIGISSPYYSMGKQRQEDESRSAQLGRSASSQKLYPELLSDDSNQVQSHLTVSTKQGQLHLVYDDDTSDLMVIHDCSPQHQSLKQQPPPHGTGLDDILPGPLVKYLMQKFVKIRPAMLPMIGTRSILESIHNRPTNPLLISAICSYVTTFTPENDRMFVKYGIDQKRLIQQLEEKEDELLRTAFLEPTISNIQAIIILCCHPTEVTYPSIWLRAGIAIRMSQDLGLHRSLTNTSNSKKVRELGNLLWHCVYILDRWSCAVLGRPLAIVDSDCNVDLPDDSDGGGSHDDEQDYTFFTAFIKLSGILGEIQRRIYSPKAKASLGCHGTSTTNTVNSLQRLLFDWYDQLPLDDRLTDNDMARMASPATTKEEKDALQQSKKWRLVAPLMSTYYAVTILLHRPFIIPDNELLFNPTSAKRCMEMAALATDTVALMDVSNFTYFCWNILVFSLTVPVSIHLFNCSSDQPDVSQTGRHYLNKAMENYHNLESEFPLAPKITCNSPLQFAISFLGPQWVTTQRLSTSPSVHSSSSEISRPVDPSSSSASSFSTVNTRQDQQQKEHQKQPQLHQQQQQPHQQQQSPVRGDAELQFEQPPSFQFEPMNPSQPMTYPLPEVIATSSDSVGLTMENQLPNQDSWQQLFLNNTGQFAFSDGKQSDDFWQCLSLF